MGRKWVSKEYIFQVVWCKEVIVEDEVVQWSVVNVRSDK